MNLKNIKLFLSDVDGCMTNGTVYVGVEQELVGFDIQDGIGHRLADYAGIKVGWLSGRHSEPVGVRARKLKVPHLYQGVTDKLKKAKEHCEKEGLSLSQVAYLGDDLIDIPLLQKVGWAVAVKNARPEVKEVAHYVTRAHGGEGAFREAVEKLIKAQGCWKQTLKKFHETNSAPPPRFNLD
jgi:3-deoxy-D-manno-octulosonate 8-phosphate phosphatase (KDO 8-P phosphatase)